MKCAYPNTQVVQVKEPKPRGFFSRLIWRFLRYDWLEPEKIYLTIEPPTNARVKLRAAWIEWPSGEIFGAGVTGESSAAIKVGFTESPGDKAVPFEGAIWEARKQNG